MDNIISVLHDNSKAVYIPEGFTPDKPLVLCVLPNLSLNGAQTVFLEILNILNEHCDYRYCIISPEDGSYREVFTALNCIVCIRPFVVVSDDFRKFLQDSFVSVFLNTALVHGYSMYFVNTDIPVFWWIHESSEHLQACCQSMPNPNLLSSNFHIYGVTSRVDRAYRDLYDYPLPVMHMSIQDMHDNYSSKRKDDKTTFLIPAAYTPIKGQDILLQAISMLPQEYQEKASFLFCGYRTSDNDEYYDNIMRLSSAYPCITHLGQLTKEQVYQKYADCDCVVAPSRTDPTPTTIVEAMMFHKLTLVSDNTGISEYITDCVNGFVFHDIDDLVKRLLLIISDTKALNPVAERGSNIWKDHFSPEGISKILLGSGVF